MPMRLLIAAGEAATRVRDLPPGVRELIETADEILVIAPELPTRFEWLSSDTDKEREQADERLRVILEHIGEVGTAPRGTIGADDPLLAFEDALGSFAADHILIGLRAVERSDWQERGLLDGLLRFGLPVTAFSVPGD
jgi:hypothetical protein